MRKNTQKGFTLIELLVVIAIIGILATIVLTSLGSARTKANDTRVQGQLSSMRAQAEIYYSTNGSYSTTVGQALGACTTATLFTTAASSNGLAGLLAGWGSGYYAECTALPSTGASSSWMVSATNGTAWNTGATEGWCVDNTGQSKYYTASTTVPVPWAGANLTTITGGLCP